MRYDDRSFAGLLFAFGSVQFFLVMLVCEGALPGYSVSSQAISDLGVGPTAALFNASVFLLGVLSLVGAYFYHRTHGIRWITILFLLAGIGPVGVGIFPETSRLPHSVFAFLAFVFGGVVAIVVATRQRPPLRYMSLVLGALGLVALVLFVTGQYLGIGFGGMERMIVYPVLVWQAAFGAHLMSAPQAARGPGPSNGS